MGGTHPKTYGFNTISPYFNPIESRFLRGAAPYLPYRGFFPKEIFLYGGRTDFWPYLEKCSADFDDARTKMIGNVILNMKNNSKAGEHARTAGYMVPTDF